MGYQAQLVIRARDPERARIVERVKELADEQGKSIVEMAFELLERGMTTMGTAPMAAPPTEKVESKPVDETPVATTPAEPEAKPEPVVEEKPATPVSHARSPEASAPISSKPLSDLVDEIPEKAEYHGEPPEELAVRCAEIFSTEGASKAAMTLTGFFAGAEPGEAAIFREALQEKINMADYIAILEILKETDEYKQYRRRVVYS